MKPEEKAQQLVDSFTLQAYYISGEAPDRKEIAKDQALICVNEILNSMDLDDENRGFWQDVKTEIPNL